MTAWRCDVLSVASVKSASGAANYFAKDDYHAAEYYAGEHATEASGWAGEGAKALGLTGEEVITIGALANGEAKTVSVTAERDGADPVTFEATVRLDTPTEVRYIQNGGILQTVLRDLNA